jgi:DNA-binding NarL/FixJ family response regulator
MAPGSTVPNQPASVAKPKVLLVDDHPDILKSVARLLAFDFEVAGLATDGRQAIEAAHQVTPDIIVLDITMPGRDGFQTARDLQRNGSRAPIVFLSMHESDDFVGQGFRSGARGYVVKTRLHEDLVMALERVLSGQLFVPSLKSLMALEQDQSRHAVQIYSDDHACVEGLSGFVNLALRRGDVVSVVSTPPIRAGIAERLRKQGWSVGESGQHGRYRASDSADAEAALVRDGHACRNCIEEALAELDEWRLADAAGPGARVTVVGEISAGMLLNGNSRPAIELEQLWSELTRTRPFQTVCFYPIERFSDQADANLLPHLCAEHDAVTHAPEDPARFLLA